VEGAVQGARAQALENGFEHGSASQW
jgi:hypothetical protein